MSRCLLDEGSLSLTLKPDDLTIIAGFSSDDFEDQIAERLVDAYQHLPLQCWHMNDIGELVLCSIEALAPYTWQMFDGELIKQLLTLAIDVARQVIPFYLRSF